MTYKRLYDKNDRYYSQAIALYERNFIVSERRDADEQRRIMKEDDYHFEVILDGDVFCGFIFFWETQKFLYLEHLCIVEEQRGKSIGSQALNYLKSKNKNVIIEIEPIVDETTLKRKIFYENNGFCVNPHKHIQVKYRKEDSDLELLILTLTNPISKQEYDEFYNYLLEKVQIQTQEKGEIVIRRANRQDDLEMIAELVYYSDNYIYPYMLNGVEEGKKLISQMILSPTIYNLDNLLVAQMRGHIVGVLVWVERPVTYYLEDFKTCFEKCGIEFGEKQLKVWKDYYAYMNERQNLIYIANLCVSSSCRGMGIATLLFNEVFKLGNEFMLECVKANNNAVKLYEKLGFEITGEYPGFTEIPCYKMQKKRRK